MIKKSIITALLTLVVKTGLAQENRQKDAT
jgi:hypothetical protein